MRKRSAGFTLLEFLIAVVVVGVLAFGGYVFIGRKLVDKRGPIQLAKDNGYVEPKIYQRHDVLAWHYGCSFKEKVAFEVQANKPNGEFVTLTVCCKDWFDGCVLKDPK